MKLLTKYAALLLFSAGFGLTAANTSDVMTELGIETPKLRYDVLSNLKEEKWFFFQATSSMRQIAHRIPEASRAATVRTLGKVVRSYVESSAFKREWLQDVQSRYPYDATYTAEGLAQKKQMQEAGESAMNQQMAAMNQAFAQMEPATLKMAAQVQIDQEESELASLEGNSRTVQLQRITALKKMITLPPAEFKKQYVNSLKQQAQANADQSVTDVEIDPQQLDYQRQQKAAFDAHADFYPLLKKRLQDFIALSESVDFEARLIPTGRKLVFANPVYERKCAEWKFLYRLGKGPVAEARSFAEQWLVEIPN